MNNEYIIVNKTLLEKRIKELESLGKKDKEGYNLYQIVIVELKKLLSESTPLIPEIENAYDKGSHNHHSQYTEEYDNLKQKDISKLKLDI